MKRLTDVSADALWGGTVFRTPASYPYEDVVDLMLVSETNASSGLSILLVSGHKGGRLLSDLPADSLVPGGETLAVSGKWAITHWNEWFFESDPSKVWVLEGYNAPSLPTTDH